MKELFARIFGEKRTTLIGLAVGAVAATRLAAGDATAVADLGLAAGMLVAKDA